MTLIKSISGIRGTIGGRYRTNLTPIDIVECVAGFGMWVKKQSTKTRFKIIVGRDGRISGSMVSQLAINTLIGMGIEVIDLDLSTTPTVEMMVTHLGADAGIIFTASHNPKEWNALKFLNQHGEFISAVAGAEILDLIEQGEIIFSDVDQLGNVARFSGAIDIHIDEILKLPYLNLDAIKSAGINVVVDCINSTGALALPTLLDKLRVGYSLINEAITGDFDHNPEPLPAHLIKLSAKVVELGADMGISIDPDVDRLAFVNEDGSMFGEEYTLVAVADSILNKKKGAGVSNLSSTRALADVCKKHGVPYFASAVGEVNVVNKMKESEAVIGGEGNGGVILPDLHYGRDALAGIALFLSLYAEKGKSMTELKADYPSYVIIKDKMPADSLDLNTTFSKLKQVFSQEKIDTQDGLKIDFENGWVHLRASNTEPIIRIYAEAKTEEEASSLITQVKEAIS
ncbi:MAG: phosphoglucosamine mutase [Saprospiraceae bacterium]|nr:phosphoglucosamine mutase [Saprospiraceae bacterium]